ncbi:hypothetical protein NIES2119_00680 [[Phormidium ambiguum] IAM M-71]|uniref:Uncharacterized protein n=1 Tax=[Phormidium ambiguum] IAM M-71 TaxID=454136 RepID=A0A1U7ITR2_9CYAN|nr:T3SS effector HopA1 family protein [Phormidium ambiguum]OKH40862.1 hypothetical protein NIES2119_00680 [Phormidium ambiguum IAM M-71]
MQLLDSLEIQLTSETNERLLNVLEDIVNQVEIQPNFSIRHPNYKAWELPAEVVARFQKMPEQIQQKYLSLQLQGFLYGIYYNGSMRTDLALDQEENNLPLNLENNTLLGVDVEFYERLHQSNQGEGYFSPGWYVVRQESDGSLAVTKDGLTLHIQRSQHLQSSEEHPAIGNLVAIKMPRNCVQNGFYMAVGNAGSQSHSHPSPEIVRVYFSLSPEGAIVLMKNLTQQLNNIPIPFTFKALYNPTDYGRYDSGVLYFEKSNYQVVRQVLERIYAQTKEHFYTDIPLFTKLLAPGLGLAEEPNQKFAAQESFGMNRCQIIANALLQAWHKGDNSPDSRMNAIFQQFSILGIDWQRSYLNANSEDIYTPLNL